MALPTLAVVFVSPGVAVDGGGFWVDPQGHIHPISPWDPNVRTDLAVAANLVASAGHVRNPQLATQITGVAQQIMGLHIGTIQRSMTQTVQVPQVAQRPS